MTSKKVIEELKRELNYWDVKLLESANTANNAQTKGGYRMAIALREHYQLIATRLLALIKRLEEGINE